MKRFVFAAIILLPLVFPYSVKATVEVPVCTEIGSQVHPDISGDRVVWEDGRDGSYTNIYMYDFADGSTIEIPTGEFSAMYPSISGIHIVWKEAIDISFSSLNIYCYNIISETTQVIESDISVHNMRPISISANKIIYDKGGTLWLYDLENNNKEELGEGTWAQTDGESVVCLRPPFSSEPEVYVYDLQGPDFGDLTDDSWLQYTPDISGSRVVWSDNRNGDGPGGIWDIIMYNLTDETEEVVSSGMLPGYYRTPAIDNELLVWQEYDYSPGHDSEIWLYDLSQNLRLNITNDIYHQYDPKIDHGRVVYGDQRNGLAGDIYMYAINENPRDISVTPEDEFNFGEVTIGSLSLQNITISNPGGAPLHVIDVFLEDSHSGFFIVTPLIFPVTIEPSDSISIEIGFTPTEDNHTDGLLILSDDPQDNNITVNLAGNGIGDACEVTVVPMLMLLLLNN